MPKQNAVQFQIEELFDIAYHMNVLVDRMDRTDAPLTEEETREVYLCMKNTITRSKNLIEIDNLYTIKMKRKRRRRK